MKGWRERFQPMWRRHDRIHGPAPAADAREEIAFHLEERVRELMEAGMRREEAVAEANARFGDAGRYGREVSAIGERRVRRARLIEMIDDLRQDALYAIRQLAARPSFTLGVILTLALGIGANATIFSLVDAVLLRPIPGVPAPERLVTGWNSVAYPEYLDFREASAGILDLAAFTDRSFALRSGDGSEIVRALVVTGPWFEVVGPRVIHGRDLGPDDDRIGAPPAAVLTWRLWQRLFAGDPGALGATIVLNGAPVTVVGVADEAFHGTTLSSAPDLILTARAWHGIAPAYFTRLNLDGRDWGWLRLVGRLAPGATLEQAQSALLASAASQRESTKRETPGDARARIDHAVPAAVGVDARKGVIGFAALLAGMVGLVLLIACANVASLLLARAAERRREIAVRAALGASSGRLLRQLLTESLVLSGCAGAAALAFVLLAQKGLARMTFPGGPSLGALGLHPDGALLAVIAALAALTGILFGLAPAWHASRPALGAALKESAPTDTPSRGRARSILVAVQVALSLVLLIGAGLFTRALQRAMSLDIGFDPAGVALAHVDPGLARYDAAREAAFFRDSEARARAIPGVTAAAWTFRVPLTDDEDTYSFQIPGYTPARGERTEVEVISVGAGFLDVIGGRMASGRFFDEHDVEGAPRVVVINEAMARRYWPGVDPVGRKMGIGGPKTIVGVARDARYRAPDRPAEPLVFFPFAQMLPEAGGAQRALLARTDRDPASILFDLKSAITAAGPGVPVRRLDTFEDVLGALLLPQRAGAALLGLFSLLAVIVSSIGLAGMVANNVARRTRELGIRLALGATAADLLRLVLGSSLRTIAIGVAAGLSLAALLAPAAAGFIYGVSARDAVTFAGTSAILVGVGVAAALVPARRALKVDPVRALRTD